MECLLARPSPSSASNRARRRSSPGLALETKAKLLGTDRSTTGEAVKRDVIEHRDKLISVLGPKRLQH